MMADNFSSDDRRRVVGAGVRHGRNAQIMDMRAIADLGITHSNTTHLATRGKRLALSRTRMSSKDQPFYGEMLDVLEINADAQIVKYVVFDLDDVDAAFTELDARYLAGEAADHAHTWALIARLYAGLNRHELPPTTPNFVDVDNRRLAAFAPGDIREFARTAFDQIPDLSFRIEAVHRLSNLGAVVTQALRGTSREGFEAEWCEIHLVMIEGDLFNRSEIFDEADLDAALARFDELHAQTRPLENAASRADDRFFAHTRARSWAAAAQILADNSFVDDRRRVVNIGVWDGRDAVIANIRALAEAVADVTSTVIAIRGEHLALARICAPNRDLQQGDFDVEMLCIAELDTDERIAAHVMFDLDDIAAAFEELDARYLAGEAAAHARAWSVIAGAHAGFNRHKLPATTPDPVYIDHRPLVSIEGADLAATLRAVWDITPAFSVYIEAVHRLDEFGAVATQVLNGTSQEGLDAEWRMIDVFTVEGDLISSVEVFEEADLDAALARFDELHPQAPRLENAASQVVERFWKYFAARDWDAMAETIADDFWTHDRRRVVNAGVLRGRAVHITNMRAVAEVGFGGLTSTAIATRGHRSALIRIRSSMRGAPPGEVTAEMLSIVEIDADNRLTAAVLFDSDDIDAAFEELEARYLVGEGAAHAHAWSVIARTYAAFNRHEFPSTTPDSVYIDHRPLVANDASDLTANIRATWELMDVSIYIAESVHRLSELGAVVTQTLKGTSKEGLDVEYRMIDIFTVEGDLLTGVEVFDEVDLDAALARFDELDRNAEKAR